MQDVVNMNSAIGDLQRSYLFQTQIEKYPSLLDSAITGASTIASAIDFYGEKVPFPESKNKLIRIPWAGQYRWVAGPNDDAGQGTFSIYLDKDWKSYDFFKAWKNLSGDESTGAAYAAPLCWGNVIVYAIDMDKTTINKGVKFVNFMVNHVQTINFDKGSQDITKFTINASWEKRLSIAGGGSI